MNAANPLLDIKNLHLKFDTPEGKVSAINGIDFSIPENRCIGIVGESGSGKTQLFRSILKLSGPNATVSGIANFLGEDLISASAKRMRSILGSQITMIFQDPLSSFNPYLKMSVQMTEMLMEHSDITAKQAEKVSIDMMKRVRIPEAEKRFKMYPHEFSGGMRQRMMIAMALLPYPKLIIADEPTTALDVTLQAQALEILNECRREFQLSIVFITHDLGVAASVCDEVYIMYGGRIMESGPIDEVLLKPSHPYTVGLINSIPKLSENTEELQPIPGNPINLKHLPTGCMFSERCPLAEDRCFTSSPLQEKFGENRYRACFKDAE